MTPAPRKSPPYRPSYGWPRTDRPDAARWPQTISPTTLQAAREADAAMGPDVWGCDYPGLPDPAPDEPAVPPRRLTTALLPY